jgi:hypothetical protein
MMPAVNPLRLAKDTASRGVDCMTILIFSAVSHCYGRQANDLQQQLQQLKQQYAQTTQELGPLTGNGSGILNMSVVGGATVPVLQGVIADHIGIHHGFILPVICYLYILFYALSGSKPNTERYATV